MAFTQDVGAEADPDLELQDAEFGDDYDGFFEDIDYEALGINPTSPTAAKPGSEDKVRVLAARYAAGLPLWHNKDCSGHGPGGILLPANGFGETVEEEDEDEED